jgi:tRNA wybutosine-synthesizing protein 4
MDAGWNFAEAKSLWTLWSDPGFLTTSQRQTLDEVEPFDEWEEFSLFASHYFLLSASTRDRSKESVKLPAVQPNGAPRQHHGSQAPSLKLSHNPSTKPNTERRFSVPIPVHPGMFGVHGGFGREARLASTDIYHQRVSKLPSHILTSPLHTGPWMCHSSTFLNDEDCLITGGRTSPRVATRDCWLKRAGSWQLADGLPHALFRHCAVAVSVEGCESVLVYGGKTDTGEVLGQWLLWDSSTGWQGIRASGETPSPRFGASLVNITGQSGVLFGGMTLDGVTLEDFWTWSITRAEDRTLSINLSEHTVAMRTLNGSYKWLTRFGASTSLTTWGLVIVGGVSRHGCIPQEYEIMLLDSHALGSYLKGERTLDYSILTSIRPEANPECPRPLLVGHISLVTNPKMVLVVGGGGVCFSFGTYRNQGTWLLQEAISKQENDWQLLENNPDKTSTEKATKLLGPSATSGEEITAIPRTTLSSSEDFAAVLKESKPVILTGLDIGPCRELWTKEYLEQTVGRDRKVIVHEAGSEPMNFQTKNFSYVTKDFSTFLGEVCAGGRQYLRSISSDKPTKTPANLVLDFPGLQNDFRLPPELSIASERAHSSPLRISGAINMWLHYDVNFAYH